MYLYTAFFRGRHRTRLTVVCVRMGSIGLSAIKLCIQLWLPFGSPRLKLSLIAFISHKWAYNGQQKSCERIKLAILYACFMSISRHPPLLCSLFDNISSFIALIQFYLLQWLPDDLKGLGRYLSSLRCLTVSITSCNLSGACSLISRRTSASLWSACFSRSVFW